VELSKERLEHLIAHSTDVVCATDRRGRVVYYNDGASRVLGYGEAEVMGEFVGMLYPDVDEAKRVMAAMRDPGYGGKGVADALQTRFRAKSGEEIPVAITGTLLYDDAGREDGTIGFAKDLREILRKDQLATVGEVAIGLSHEINNPLAVITNQVELLERDVERLAGDRDCSVEEERIDALRREVARISEILTRLGEIAQGDEYETVEYIGPTKMIDLHQHRARRGDAEPKLTGLRILVADDDLGIANSLAELLRAEGCRVDTASDGLEALAKLESQPFDLLLSDVVMPNMDGYELFQRVREALPDLPILMMTAFHYDKDHIIKRSRMSGLEGVIFKKPVDPDRLRAKIRELVGETAGGP